MINISHPLRFWNGWGEHAPGVMIEVTFEKGSTTSSLEVFSFARESPSARKFSAPHNYPIRLSRPKSPGSSRRKPVAGTVGW
ncbi:hypothetical protein OMCYN_00710 [cyanobiont of Ornithocercus magnificus]|nr:hypothetical protein OMCYN_00710 [cyanobiont of Ornithocercus magnificus]